MLKVFTPARRQKMKHREMRGSETAPTLLAVAVVAAIAQRSTQLRIHSHQHPRQQMQFALQKREQRSRQSRLSLLVQRLGRLEQARQEQRRAQ